MCSKLHFVEETIAVTEAKKLGKAGGTLPSTYYNKLELLRPHTPGQFQPSSPTCGPTNKNQEQNINVNGKFKT